MLDRSVAPIIHPIQEIHFPEVNSYELDNGIPLYSMIGGSQEVLKLELVFKAGRCQESNKLVAKACNQLLKEGTNKFSSQQLAEEIDFYGSTISCQSGMDSASITLYCMKKYFQESLALLQEILENATFPVEEIKKYGLRASEGLKQQLSKNSVVAYRKFSAEIFGSNHSYGYNSEPDDYLNIKQSELLSHYEAYYTKEHCKIFLSGSTSSDTISLINTTLGKFDRIGKKQKAYQKINSSPAKILNFTGNKLQNSIKIGKKLFNRKHPEYYPFMMMNTVLGGYFGSRLMSSIREEKGYTYSIYSILDPLYNDGSFYVSTEVGESYYSLTLEAIQEEFDKLQQNQISDKELDMAKNYMLGNFLSMLDGPLKTSKVLRMLIENDFEVEDFNNIINVVKSITKKQIQDLAQKHLNSKEMLFVSVGDF